MNELKELLEPWLTWLGPNKYIQSGAIFLLSIIAAKTGDFIICRVIGRLVRRTETELDDKIISILHRPLFISFVLLGLTLATMRLQLPGRFTFAILALLETLAVLVWLVFAVRFTGLVLTYLSLIHNRYNMIQNSTLPLMINLARILLVGGAG